MAERIRIARRHGLILQEKQLEPVGIIEDYLVIRSVFDSLSFYVVLGCVIKLEKHSRFSPYLEHEL